MNHIKQEQLKGAGMFAFLSLSIFDKYNINKSKNKYKELRLDFIANAKTNVWDNPHAIFKGRFIYIIIMDTYLIYHMNQEHKYITSCIGVEKNKSTMIIKINKYIKENSLNIFDIIKYYLTIK